LERDQVRDWLASAAIYASPARYEPFGLGALEAALSGCALVLGDTESLREIWQDAALFIRPEDPEEIRATLLELIHKPSLRDDFSRRARKRAGSFTAERMARAYREVYAKLLRSHRGQRSEEVIQGEHPS
jgi:glycosyltransferase involved in cell wall biosynthesis